MHTKRLWFGFLLVLMLAVPALAQGGPTVTVQGDSAEDMRAFLSRYVGWQGAPGAGGEITISGMPADLPFTLPLPPDGLLLGSMRLPQFETGQLFHILADSALPPEQLLAFYADNLSPDEWTAVTIGPAGGGFVTGQIFQAAYCHMAEDAALIIRAQQFYERLATLQLTAQVGDTAMLCTNQDPEQVSAAAYSLLPQLAAPEGASIVGDASSRDGIGPRGERFASTSAALRAEMPASALLDAYNAQLEALGWLLMRTEGNGGFAWSGWTFLDAAGETWAATLTITADPLAEHEFMALLWIRAAG